jgi:phenylpropionate dioxygenase-like ring-hydroxylating dioxygenase large terminal subunit
MSVNGRPSTSRLATGGRIVRKEENEILTRIGPGTPCGAMLRHYWWPVTCSGYVGKRPMKIKLLGEEFVLFRKPDGQFGMLDLHCAHRGASLEFGRVEANGLRCCYHGWLYDEKGNCLDQMCEPGGGQHRGNYKQGAYPVIEKSGLVFAYIGPGEPPAFPKWDVLFDDNCNKVVHGRDAHGNWLQRAENMLDALHVMCLHGSLYPELAEERPHRLDFDETWYGIDMHLDYPNGIRDRHHYMFPALNRIQVCRVGQRPHQFIQWVVPHDDTHCTTFQIWASEGDPPPYKITTGAFQKTEPGDFKRVEDEWWGLWERDQDDAAIESQGLITDRTREHLATCDVGIVKMRRMVLASIDAVAKGQPPVGAIPPHDGIIELETYKTELGDNPEQIRRPDDGRKLEIIAPYDVAK